MVKLVKPTTKNSPSIHRGKISGNQPAEAYAKPHTMSGKSVTIQKASAYEPGAEVINHMNPSAGMVSKGNYKPVKTDGIKIRGTGAATKGVMARGPMA
jgi:hypothetical protein